jgi:hypothetical protein
MLLMSNCPPSPLWILLLIKQSLKRIQSKEKLVWRSERVPDFANGKVILNAVSILKDHLLGLE